MFPEGGESPSQCTAATFATCSSIASRTGRLQLGGEAAEGNRRPAKCCAGCACCGRCRWYRRPSCAYSGYWSRAANSFGASFGCSPGKRQTFARQTLVEVAGRVRAGFAPVSDQEQEREWAAHVYKQNISLGAHTLLSSAPWQPELAQHSKARHSHMHGGQRCSFCMWGAGLWVFLLGRFYTSRIRHNTCTAQVLGI